jgi:hypothetical protein
MKMIVPVTSDPRIVRLAQRGDLPSEPTWRLARLLMEMQRGQAQKGEEDDRK